MKVGVITADWGRGPKRDDGSHKPLKGGSSWNRIHMPLGEVAKHGVEIIISERVALGDSGPILIDWRTGLTHTGFDILVMQRIMNDYSLQIIEGCNSKGIPVVQDVDDWYWGLHPDNNAYKVTDPKVNPTCNRDIYKESLLASDLIITSTPFLYNKLAEWNPNTILIRNTIDLERWEETEIRDKPIVGWVGATTHRSGDLETLQGIVAPYLERHDLMFHQGGWAEGSRHAAELLKVPLERSQTSRLCPIEVYPQHFSFMDISIVPLNMIPFNEAKSGLKGMESAASGTPFIAQASEEYRWLRDDIGVGRVAKKGNQWTRHLEELLDRDARVEEARKNREAIKALDIRDRWVDWFKAFESLT